MLGNMMSKVESLEYANKQLVERVTEIETNYNKLVELLGVNRETRNGNKRERPRSPSPPPRRRRERSRSPRRRRSMSRSNGEATVAPELSENERDALPGVHVTFDNNTQRWTESEAYKFGSAFGVVRHIFIPGGSASTHKWLHINFANVADRDECINSELVRDHYPGVTLTRKRSRKDGNV